jgi:hypothetical protein
MYDTASRVGVPRPMTKTKGVLCVQRYPVQADWGPDAPPRRVVGQQEKLSECWRLTTRRVPWI